MAAWGETLAHLANVRWCLAIETSATKRSDAPGSALHTSVKSQNPYIKQSRKCNLYLKISSSVRSSFCTRTKSVVGVFCTTKGVQMCTRFVGSKEIAVGHFPYRFRTTKSLYGSFNSIVTLKLTRRCCTVLSVCPTCTVCNDHKQTARTDVQDGRPRPVTTVTSE